MEKAVKYAIFGASGAVGKSLAPAIAATRQRFRVVGRSEESLRKNFSQYEPLVEYQAADLSDPKQAAEAAAGVDTAFYLVGVPYTQFELHPKLSRVALDAAAGAGVRRFVHLATVYPFGKPQREKVDESHPRDPHTFKGKMRKEQEDLVFAADGRNGMRTTVLRPPDFFGPGSELSYAHSMFTAALNGGKADVIGPIDTPHEFIFVPDVAATLLALSAKEEAYGTSWNLAGPGLITTRDFAELIFEAAGQHPRLRVADRMVLRLMGLFNGFMKEVLEMHYLWTTPVALDDSRLLRLLPGLKKTSYEDGVQATLASMRGKATAAGA